MNVFDKNAKLMHRAHAAKAANVADFDYLKEEIGYRLSDRVLDIKRQVDVAVDIGCGRGYVTRHITGHSVKKLIAVDSSPEMLDQCQLPAAEEELDSSKVLLDFDSPGGLSLFEDESVDLVTTNLSMHWVNDLPGLFKEVNRILKKDGAFIGSMFGGETLFELRVSLQLAGLERQGGISSHISPFVSPQDLGGLLNRSGFTLLTIDSDEVGAAFPSIFHLMRDLRGMAENNATWSRSLHLRRDNLLAASAIYRDLYATEDDYLPATFQVFYWIGWKPDPTKQPKPLEPHRDSDVSFKDIENLDSVLHKFDPNKINNNNDNDRGAK